MITFSFALQILAIIFTMLFITAAAFLFSEHEKTAGSRLLLSAFVLFLFLMLVSLLGDLYAQIAIYTILLTLILLFFPRLKMKNSKAEKPNSRYDERDIMFSRMELAPTTKRYENYYTQNPEKKTIDDEIRKNPGLLSPASKFYNKEIFAATNANFEIIKSLHNIVSGKVATHKCNISSSDAKSLVKQFLKNNGTHSAGIALLKDYHWYSIKGRGDEYGNEIVPNHKFGIAFTVEMQTETTFAAPAAPIVYESSKQYLNSGRIAVQLAAFIRNLGFDARAHIDGNYQLICPLVARDAGLGEIGRMGLLMTPQLGPRVRIAVVTTNMPLVADSYKPETTMLEFCNNCKKCAETCPGKAIPNGAMETTDNTLRWQINSEKCYNYWTIAGTDCGRCMAVCPYSHPNNAMHRFVRNAIRYSAIFARVAIFFDDFLYLRKPKPKKTPDWMSEKQSYND